MLRPATLQSIVEQEESEGSTIAGNQGTVHLGAPPEPAGGSDTDPENPLIKQSASMVDGSADQGTSGERTGGITNIATQPNVTQQMGNVTTEQSAVNEPTVVTQNKETSEGQQTVVSTAQPGGSGLTDISQNNEDLPPLLNEVIEQQQLANSSNLMLDDHDFEFTSPRNALENSQSSSSMQPPTVNSRSRPLVKVKRSKSVPPKVHLYKSCTKDEINRVIELLKIPKDTRRLFFEKKASERRRWFLQARRKKDKQLSKVVQVYPNKTNCAKRVFKIEDDNQYGTQIARGMASIFTPATLAELTDEDELLSKLKKARIANDFAAFKRVDRGLAQFYPMTSVTDEGLLLVDNRIAIPEGFRKPILNHLHRGHPGQEKMIDAAMYIWWPKMHREIIKKSESCTECTAYGKNIKTLKPRSNWDPIPEPSEPNEEVQLDFAGPFDLKVLNTIFLSQLTVSLDFPLP